MYYVGFMGHWSEVDFTITVMQLDAHCWQRKSNPVITVYEAQANPADHQKIKGLDGSFSTPQM